MSVRTILAELQRSIAEKYTERQAAVEALAKLRAEEAPDETAVEAALATRKSIDEELNAMEARAAELRAEISEDEAAEARAKEARAIAEAPGIPVERARVVGHEAVYRKDEDPDGHRFLRDVAAQAIGSSVARERLERHTHQVFDERKQAGRPVNERATSSANFAGFAVPEYLVDLYAPAAKAGAPLVQNMRQLELPETGMTAYISKVTTGTSAAEQTTENSSVSETDIDDTLISVPIFTCAGSQTVSRQAIERAPGSLEVTIEDLIREYWTDVDRKAISRNTTGLDAAATADTYTDSTPTAGEFYSKLLGSQLAVEDALLDQSTSPDDIIVLMANRRWIWLTNQMVSTWPFVGGRRAGSNGQGLLSGEGYGAGIRGYLPNDQPVIVDGNIPTTLGTGSNEDVAYVFSRREAFIWLDKDQPMMIKAEQPNAKKLGVDLVVYGYAATCFSRYAGAVRKVGGTGMVAPTF